MAIDRRKAVYIKGSGNMPTAPANDSTPPSAPGTPFLVASSDFDVTIGYTASASADIARYMAYADGSTIPCGETEGPATTMKLYGLEPGVHSVVVQAVDGSGNFSAGSAAGSIRQPRPGDKERGIFGSFAELPPASEFGVGLAQVGGAIVCW